MTSAESYAQRVAAHAMNLAAAAGGVRHDGLVLVVVAFPLAAVFFLATRLFTQPDRTVEAYSYGRYLGVRIFRWVLLGLGIVGLVLLIVGS
jgi:hypothetical protein